MTSDTLDNIKRDGPDDYEHTCDGCRSLDFKLDKLIEYIAALESRIRE